MVVTRRGIGDECMEMDRLRVHAIGNERPELRRFGWSFWWRAKGVDLERYGAKGLEKACSV